MSAQDACGGVPRRGQRLEGSGPHDGVAVLDVHTPGRRFVAVPEIHGQGTCLCFGVAAHDSGGRRSHAQVVPVAAPRPVFCCLKPVGLGGLWCELLKSLGQRDGPRGPARVFEGVGTEAQFGVTGQKPQVVAVENESRPEGFLRVVVVLVVVLGGVPEGQPAIQIGARAELVQTRLGGPPHGCVSSSYEQLLAALLVLIDRRHPGSPHRCHALLTVCARLRADLRRPRHLRWISM